MEHEVSMDTYDTLGSSSRRLERRNASRRLSVPSLPSTTTAAGTTGDSERERHNHKRFSSLSRWVSSPSSRTSFPSHKGNIKKHKDIKMEKLQTTQKPQKPQKPQKSQKTEKTVKKKQKNKKEKEKREKKIKRDKKYKKNNIKNTSQYRSAPHLPSIRDEALHANTRVVDDSDRVHLLRNEVDGLREICVHNLDSAMERGENLQHLDSTVESLGDVSSNFRRHSGGLHRSMRCGKYRCYAILGITVVSFLVAICLAITMMACGNLTCAQLYANQTNTPAPSLPAPIVDPPQLPKTPLPSPLPMPTQAPQSIPTIEPTQPAPSSHSTERLHVIERDKKNKES